MHVINVFDKMNKNSILAGGDDIYLSPISVCIKIVSVIVAKPLLLQE